MSGIHGILCEGYFFFGPHACFKHGIAEYCEGKSRISCPACSVCGGDVIFYAHDMIGHCMTCRAERDSAGHPILRQQVDVVGMMILMQCQAELRAIKDACDNYDEFGYPMRPEHELPELATRVCCIMAEMADTIHSAKEAMSGSILTPPPRGEGVK